MAKVNFNKLKKEVIDSAQQGLLKCAFLTKERLKQNVGYTDHSQEDLDRIGNPYAESHPQSLHQPVFKELDGTDQALAGMPVHTKGHGTKPQDQTGQLYNSIAIVKESPNSYAIGADENITDENGTKYVIDVIEGTSLMEARNFPLWTLMELEENKVLEKTMETCIKKGLGNI